jgi:hypothetical protein
MDNLHFFMFSSGEYSDYCVGGMYVCDHIVNAEGWRQFAKDKQEQRQKVRNDSILKYRARTGEGSTLYYGVHEGWYASEECEEFRKYCDENCPKDLFIKAHGMRKVEYTELWEY